MEKKTLQNLVAMIKNFDIRDNEETQTQDFNQAFNSTLSKDRQNTLAFNCVRSYEYKFTAKKPYKNLKCKKIL